MSDIAVKVDNDILISANVTNESKENLGLKEGSEVLVLVKSSFVILTKQKLRSTARNNIKAVVDEVKKIRLFKKASEEAVSLERPTISRTPWS